MERERIFRYFRRKAAARDDLSRGVFDSSPMGDLAFLLLIFFIVTSSFIIRQGIFLSLPSKSKGAVRLDEKQVATLVPTAKAWVLNRRTVDRETLARELSELKKETENLVVVIGMADDLPYDRFVDTLSATRESGVERITIRNMVEEEI